MNYLVDMALSPKTVNVLRNSGYEAVRVSELGMAKSKDREILSSFYGMPLGKLFQCVFPNAYRVNDLDNISDGNYIGFW